MTPAVGSTPKSAALTDNPPAPAVRPLPKCPAAPIFATRFQTVAAAIPTTHDVLFLFGYFAAQHASAVTIRLLDSNKQPGRRCCEPRSPLERPGCVRRVRVCRRCSAGSFLGTGRNAPTPITDTGENILSGVSYWRGVSAIHAVASTRQRSRRRRDAR